LAAYHLWAFRTPVGARGATELTTSSSRALEMLLGLHLDQGQGMFFQQPLLLGGVAALLPFARLRPRAALFWLALYASLVVPNSLEIARFGGGGPAGRFGWSAEWLWIVPLGFVIAEYRDAFTRYVAPAAVACVVYQAALAVRWLANPHVLFPDLDERISVRNSLFPIPMRSWLPSFSFRDFSSYWTYLPKRSRVRERRHDTVERRARKRQKSHALAFSHVSHLVQPESAVRPRDAASIRRA
jgi:hypothetical protein